MSTEEKILVAHVTVSDMTMTVLPDGVQSALTDLVGHPALGTEARVVYGEMTKIEFENLPELL